MTLTKIVIWQLYHIGLASRCLMCWCHVIAYQRTCGIIESSWTTSPITSPISIQLESSRRTRVPSEHFEPAIPAQQSTCILQLGQPGVAPTATIYNEKYINVTGLSLYKLCSGVVKADVTPVLQVVTMQYSCVTTMCSLDQNSKTYAVPYQCLWQLDRH